MGVFLLSLFRVMAFDTWADYANTMLYRAEIEHFNSDASKLSKCQERACYGV